jgi:hypothetical protein
MKEYKVISISDNGSKGLNKIIEELTIEINRYLNNGAILNGGISMTNFEEIYTVSQAITIIRNLPPDGKEDN